MSIRRKLLAPALALSSLFCAAAVGQAPAQQPTPAPVVEMQKTALPDAPQPQATPAQPGQLRAAFPKIDPFALPKPDYFKPHYFDPVGPPVSKNGNPYDFLSPKLGKIAGYVDQHSNDAQYPFDFAMGYKLTDRFSIMGGTLVNMQANGGKYWADRFTLRQMTGLPDWETVGLRNALYGQPPGNPNNVNDGYGVAIRINLGHKK